MGSLSSQQIGQGSVTVGFVVGAVPFGLEVEEESLGEVVFVFDYDDEWSWQFGHGFHKCW